MLKGCSMSLWECMSVGDAVMSQLVVNGGCGRCFTACLTFVLILITTRAKHAPRVTTATDHTPILDTGTLSICKWRYQIYCYLMPLICSNMKTPLLDMLPPKNNNPRIYLMQQFPLKPRTMPSSRAATQLFL